MESRDSTALGLIGLGIAALIYGAVLGFWPVSIGDGTSCGSALAPSSEVFGTDELACRVGAGGAGRQLQAIGALAAGVALAGFGALLKVNAMGSSAAAPAPPAPPAPPARPAPITSMPNLPPRTDAMIGQPKGWYTDGYGDNRWWSGDGWTENVRR